MRIHDLISEIKEKSTNTPRKASFDIYNLLENNKKLFLQHLDGDVYKQILASFEELAYANAVTFNSSGYKDDFQKSYNLLAFYLDRIL